MCEEDEVLGWRLGVAPLPKTVPKEVDGMTEAFRRSIFYCPCHRAGQQRATAFIEGHADRSLRGQVEEMLEYGCDQLVDEQ